MSSPARRLERLPEQRTVPRVPSQPELAVWRVYLSTYGRVTQELDAALQAAHALSLSSYQALDALATGDGRLRMTDLADRVGLSRSGLTRLVDRLERAGLARREPCPSDARGTVVVVTDDGRSRLRAALPTYAHAVTRNLLGRLSVGEVHLLGALLSRLGAFRS